MKTLTSCLLLFLANQCYSDSSYTTKYDGIDLDEILGSQRLLTGYIKCLLDIGPCSPDGQELKDNLPDAIDNNCNKCTQKQREGADKVMRYIIDNRPEDWEKLEAKYNPDGSYKLTYLATKLKEQNDHVVKVDSSTEEEANESGDDNYGNDDNSGNKND